MFLGPCNVTIKSISTSRANLQQSQSIPLQALANQQYNAISLLESLIHTNLLYNPSVRHTICKPSVHLLTVEFYNTIRHLQI